MSQERSFQHVAERVNRSLGLEPEREKPQAPLFGKIVAGRDVIIITHPVDIREVMAARQS